MEFKEHNTWPSRLKNGMSLKPEIDIFWLVEGASSDPRIHMMYSERTHSDMESAESSDVSSETSETSSDVLGGLAREFPEISAEVEAEIREEDRRRAEEGDRESYQSLFSIRWCGSVTY